MAETTTIQKGWLTDFNDQLFAPYTVSDLVLMKTSGEKLDTYIESRFSDTAATVNTTKLLVDLTSDEAGTFKVGSSVSLGVNGILDAPNGGTGRNSLTVNHILYGNGSNAVNLLAPALGLLGVDVENGTPKYLELKGNWTGGDKAGPILNIVAGNLSYAVDAIPIAGKDASGIVTNQPQIFYGAKSFAQGVNVESGLNVTSGGLAVVGGIDAKGSNITNVGKPTDDAHAANKQYVDSAESGLATRIDNLVLVVGDEGSSKPATSHETRIDNLEAYRSTHEGEFDTLKTYINYDAFGDALYIIGGKDSSGNTIVDGTEGTTAPVYAYFNNTGVHAIDLTVDGTTFSNVASRLGIAEGDIDTIFSILGEEAYNTEKKDHYTRLNNIDTAIAGLNGTLTSTKTDLENKIAAETVAREGQDTIIEGWISDLQDKDTATGLNIETIYSILGETTLNTTLGSHVAQLSNLQTAITAEQTNREKAITDTVASINSTTLQVNLASDSAGTFSMGNSVSLGVTGILDVPNGGTGAATFTANSLLIGNGVNPLGQISTNKGLLLQNQDGTLSFGGDIKVQWFATASELNSYIDWVSGDGNAQTLSLAASSSPNSGMVTSIPMATEEYCGLMSAASQTFGGTKTFSGLLTASDGLDITKGQLTAYEAARFMSTVVFDGTIGSALLPSTGYAYLLGSSSYPWGSIYGKELIVKDSSGIGYIKSSNATSFMTVQDASLSMTTPIIYLNGQKIVLNSNNYGTSLPTEGMEEGQIFFLLT